MPATKLSNAERREITLAALRREKSVSQIASERGLNRARIYQLIDEARSSPRGAVAEAEAELEFRRRVVEILDD